MTQMMYLVFADLDPQSVTSATGVEPTRVIDREGKRGWRREWILNSAADSVSSPLDHLSSIFDKLEPRWHDVVSIAHKCDVYLIWVIDMSANDDNTPGCTLTKEAIARLAEIGASVDVDIV